MITGKAIEIRVEKLEQEKCQMEKRRDGCEISRPHVALYPAVTAGLGHLIPFLEFARNLVSSHSFAVTLITPTLIPYPTHAKYVSHLVSSNPLTICHVEFPEILLDEQDTKDVEKLFLAQVSSFMPAMEQSLRKLQLPNYSPFSPVCALICDLFNAESLDVGTRLGLPTYVFFTSSAAFLCLLSFPQLSHGHPVSVNIPGWKKPFHEKDFPNLSQNILRLCSPLRGMKAILVNTFHDLEAHAIHALMSGSVEEIDSLPPVHAIGPITRPVDIPQAEGGGAERPVDTPQVEGGGGERRVGMPQGEGEGEGEGAQRSVGMPQVEGEGGERLKMWLDSRAKASVVFASFGTYGFMSREQLREIALGFEASGVNFVWVVRGIGKIGNATLDVELSSVLPEGFLGRVEGRGQVLSSWAPQVGLLSHPAVGAFVSHCGWNSVLEAIWFGVPIVAWPLYAEQRMNCLLVVNELMVGLEAVKGEDGLVAQTELQSVLEKVMDGDEGRIVRRNMEELSLKARCAVREKEGSSFVSMEAAFSGLLRWTDSKHTH